MNIRARFVWIISVMSVALVGTVCFVVLRGDGVSAHATRLLTFADTPIAVEYLTTPEAHALGLSGRDTLARGTGMLFAFSTDATHGIWMPDMHFAIDILWLDAELRVVDIAHGIQPDSYPQVFEPEELSRYVLEVPAGYVTEIGVSVGDLAVLE